MTTTCQQLCSKRGCVSPSRIGCVTRFESHSGAGGSCATSGLPAKNSVAQQEPPEAPDVLELRIATLESLGMPPRRTEELLDDIPEGWHGQDVLNPRNECCGRRRNCPRPLGGHAAARGSATRGYKVQEPMRTTVPRTRCRGRCRRRCRVPDTIEPKRAAAEDDDDGGGGAR